MPDYEIINASTHKKETPSECFLVIIYDNQKIKEFNLKKDFNKPIVTIGRDIKGNDVDIPLDSPLISEKHAIIEIDGTECKVYDPNDADNGGIYFNGEKMQPGIENSKKLSNGTIIQIDNILLPQPEGVVMIYSTCPIDGNWSKVILNKETVKIGRDESCDITINHPSVSKKHATIYKKDNNRFVIERKDTSTKGIIVNKLFINGKPFSKAHKLQEWDVICIANSKLIYTSGIIIHNENISKVTLNVSALSHTLKEKGARKEILRNVSLEIEPGKFVAIIGGVNSGKTTFLNAVSGFERADSGSVKFNNLDLYENYDHLKSMIGYIPQHDIMHGNLKLRRMLTYTTKIHLANRLAKDLTKAEIDKKIDKVLSTLKLRNKEDAKINSLNAGERKRANIAIELLAEPNIFFFDNPGLGLDPYTEEKLMRELRKLAESGKTVLMVTHNPKILSYCDEIIVFGSGGHMCFYGDMQFLKEFFEKDPEGKETKFTGDVYSVYELVSDEGDPKGWAKKFSVPLSDKNDTSSSALVKKKKNVPFFMQYSALCGRYLETICNDKKKLIMLAVQPIILAILVWLITLSKDNLFEVFEETGLVLFAMVCASIFMGLFNSIQEICSERPIVKREYLVSLRLSAYVTSKITVQFLLAFLQGIAFTLVCILTFIWPISRDLIAHVASVIIITIFTSAAFGLFISSIIKKNDHIMQVVSCILMFQLLFAGTLFPIGEALNFVSYATISHWTDRLLGMIVGLYGMFSIQLAGAMYDPIYAPTIINYLGSVGVLLLFNFICTILSILILHNVSKDTR